MNWRAETNETKMKTELIDLGVIVLVCLCCFFIGFSVGHSTLRTEAVKQGYAEYNSTTGNWQWKTNAPAVK